MTVSADPPLVVLATDSEVPSGVGEHMLALARALSEGHRVVLAFPPTEEAATFLRRGKRSGFEVRPIGSDAAFIHWLKQVAPAVLHVHAGIAWEGHGLANAGWKAGVPVVRTEHLPYVLTDEAQMVEHRLGTAMVDHLVFVSEACAQTYFDAGVPRTRGTIVRNGIEIPAPRKQRDATRDAIDVAREDFLVVTVARFTAQKNYPLLVAAARLVADVAPKTRFVWVGQGPERAAIERQVGEAGLTGTVTFLGERGDVPDLLLAADLFVLPSRFEGLPLALLEAMAIGVAIVATRIGGTCEALGDDYPALVEPDDAGALAAAIVGCVTDDTHRCKLGERNRNRFGEMFSADRMGREMAALYEAVMAERACLA